MNKKSQIEKIQNAWNSSRWEGIERPYNAKEVYDLRGSVKIEYTLAMLGAERLWKLLTHDKFVRALGALTGNQAVQQVQAGLKSIYLSGWQVAADANNAGHTYPDQSLYPANSVPSVVKRINNALSRADQISHLEGKDDIYWFAPIVADAEAGFGGSLNVFELMKAMIEAGAAGVHFEDQHSSAKKCGHLGGKVLVPTREFINTLVSARLASDIMGVPTVLIARTDANSANLLTNDIDERDQKFIYGKRTFEGFFNIKGGLECAIERGLSYSPYADVIWCETAHPDLIEAKEFADGIHEQFPGKLLAYNCSPSFNWKRNLNDNQIADFQEKLAEMGYKYQFITLAGFHALNTTMFQLAMDYKDYGMSAFTKLQELEFELERTSGFKAIKHQSFVGTGYFDKVQLTITSGHTATTALEGSTEAEQFGK